jgi:DNA-binding NtrC family response regulator
MTAGRALVIGDVYTLSREQEEFLASQGIEIVHVGAQQTLAIVLEDTFDVAIAGVTFSGPDLSDVVKRLFRLDPELPIILVADDTRMRDAYVLGQNIAYDCVPRVVDNGWLVHKLKLAMLQRQLLLENRALSLSSAAEPATNGSIKGELADSDPELDDYEPEEVGDLYKSSERRVIIEALSKTRWNRRKAARLLGISYNTLRRRIDRYHLNSTYPL